PGDLELLRDRIIAGRLRDRPEVLSHRGQRAAIFWPAEDDELGVAVESRQLPKEVPDVGADSEIVQLSGVDADPHATFYPTKAAGAGLPTCPSPGSRDDSAAGSPGGCRDRRRRAAPSPPRRSCRRGPSRPAAAGR